MRRQVFTLCCALLVLAVQAAPNVEFPVAEKGSEDYGTVYHHMIDEASGERSERILGGSMASEGQFPFQVAYRSMSPIYPGNSDGFCGGMLITNTVVLTAAHCLRNFTQFEVYLGTLTPLDSAGRTTIMASRKIQHPGFNFNYGLDHDIGLLILSVPVTFSSKIQPILLPRRSDVSQNFANRVATSTGWGKIQDGGGGFINRDLLYVDVNTLPNVECEQTYSPEYVPSTKLCISTAGGTRGPCHGDSGGPLFLKNDVNEQIAIGIVSYGATAGCASGFPDVYTRISSYIDWIGANGGPAVRP